MVRRVVELAYAGLVPRVQDANDSLETSRNNPDFFVMTGSDDRQHWVVDLYAVEDCVGMLHVWERWLDIAFEF